MNSYFFDNRVHRIEVLQELRDSYLRQAAQVERLLQEEFDAPEANSGGEVLPTIAFLLQKAKEEQSS